MARLVIIIIALASGAGATWLASGSRDADFTTPAMAAVHAELEVDLVLVAARDVEPGSPVAPDGLRWQPWPRGTAAPSAILREADPEADARLLGHVARNGLVEGEPIIEARLSGPGAGNLALALPAGKRAVAVRISAERTAGGFVLPNDRVDVIHTAVRHDASSGRGASETILQDVRVLAVDQSSGDGGLAAASVVGRTATLEVSPREAELLAAAETSGAISLALRSASDAGVIEERQAPPPSAGSVRVVTPGGSQVMELGTR